MRATRNGNFDHFIRELRGGADAGFVCRFRGSHTFKLRVANLRGRDDKWL